MFFIRNGISDEEETVIEIISSWNVNNTDVEPLSSSAAS